MTSSKTKHWSAGDIIIINPILRTFSFFFPLQFSQENARLRKNLKLYEFKFLLMGLVICKKL